LLKVHDNMLSLLKKYQRTIAILILLVLIEVVLISIPQLGFKWKSPLELSSKTQDAELKTAAGLPECSDSAVYECKLGPCDGIRECKSGRYQSCALKKICEPGAVSSCEEHGCATGRRTCNECGTGYGECINDNEKGTTA